MKQIENTNCTPISGSLPACAPLAVPYIPMQQEGCETYDAKMGLIRGTIYPALDLPFMKTENKHIKSDTPMHELQAISFAINELSLYLDTHQNDAEALSLFRSYVQMYHQCVMQYEKLYGPLTVQQAGLAGTYNWLTAPWPWEYDENKEA